MRKIAKILTILTLLSATVLVTACDRDSHAGQKAADKPEKILTEIPAEYVQGQETLRVAQAFLEAAGSGDGETMSRLMADDFVWHNEGDRTIPWIGTWEGRETVFKEFMPAFGAGLQTTGWTTDYSFASHDQAVFMGTMSGVVTASGKETGTFSWAVRVQVENGKVKSWNWFEDSFAISNAYHAGAR